MVDYTATFAFIQSIYVDVTVFSIDWIISIPFIILTMVIISRDKNIWGILLLPITIFWHSIGITPSYIWYIFVTILFIIKIFSANNFANLLGSQLKKGYAETGYNKKIIKRKTVKKLYNEAYANVLKRKLGKESEIWNVDNIIEAIKKGKGKL